VQQSLLLMNNIKTNALFFVLLALIFVAYGALSFISPHDLIQWLVEYYKLDVERERLLSLYIHQMTWVKLKIALIIMCLFVLYLFCYDKELIKEYRLSFASLFYRIKKDLIAFSWNERIGLVILVLVFGSVLVYYSFSTPIQLDELHTWLFFIDRGPLVTAAYYPGSNNHIAYNLLSIPWTYVLSPVWALRMVSLCSAIGTVVVFACVLKRRYNFVWVIAGLLLLMSSACFSWYAVQGRGYVLELFCLITILYVLVQPELDFSSDRLLVLLNAMTMYCVPVAILPLALLNGYYVYRVFKSDQHHLKRIVKTTLYSIAWIFLCYLPVGIFSGFEQLVNNPFVQHISYQEAFVVGWTVYLPQIWDFISGCEGLLSICLLALLITGTFIGCLSGNQFVWIPVLVLLFPFVILQCYPVLLFERTWLWLIVPFVCWCLEVVTIFTGSGKKYTIITSAVFILVLITVNVGRSYTTNQLLVKDAQQFSLMKQAIDVHLSGKTIRVYDDVLYNYFLFYQGKIKTYQLVYGTQGSVSTTDAVLKDRKTFNLSDGKVIWLDSLHVLYQPE
jgi:hypothetical protein